MKKDEIIKSGNFRLLYPVKNFNTFVWIMKNKKSVFYRHRMYPTAFIQNLSFAMIHYGINKELFWDTIKLTKQEKKENELK